MRQKVLVLGLVMALTVSVGAQYSYKKTLADVTVSGTAGNVFTASDVQAGNGHPQATLATCALLTANIRVTVDGTTPTSSLGQVLTPGQYTFSGPDTLLNLKAIRDDSTSATLSCIVYGE